MLAKKAAVCAIVFALLLAGAWLAERQLRGEPRTEAADAMDEARGAAAAHGAARAYGPPPHAQFRSREYVKILRVGDGTEPLDP